MIPQSMVILFYKATIVVADVMMACLRHPGCLPYGDRWSVHMKAPYTGSPDLVAKWVDGTPAGWPLEALVQDLIRNHTNIPVPPIWWVLYLDESACILVMDYIPGITLGEAWPTMGIWQKLRPSRIPDCTFLVLFLRAKSWADIMPLGPFVTSEEFIELFNNGMDKAMCACLCVHKGPLKDDETLVYSHIDLAPQNLILGEDRRLWLIDFTTAGFYPRWFKYVNMVMDAWLERGKAYDAMWWASILFIADPFLGIYNWMQLVAPECL
ncbi:hypothetical protein F5146DRAFT_995084 [Armillaria mellea]|nr:hypothetical protein F5146DRAFT_995084 [Armillaria mellea]